MSTSCRRCHRNWSHRRCDFSLITCLQAVSRSNCFAPHHPRTPLVLQVPSPTATDHQSPMPPRHAAEPPLQAASRSPRQTSEPRSTSPCQEGPPCRTSARIAFPAPPHPPVSLGRPRHRDRVERGDCAGERAMPATLPWPLGQARSKAMSQSAVQHCSPWFLIFISFYISRKLN
jgi:hypothetical protein